MHSTVTENAPIYKYYVTPETPMMSSVLSTIVRSSCRQYFEQAYANVS